MLLASNKKGHLLAQVAETVCFRKGLIPAWQCVSEAFVLVLYLSAFCSRGIILKLRSHVSFKRKRQWLYLVFPEKRDSKGTLLDLWQRLCHRLHPRTSRSQMELGINEEERNSWRVQY
jgi:hypothetical protein